MTAPQMTALSAFCFIAMVFLEATLIFCKGNKNHYLVNISHCVGHSDPTEREWESRGVLLGVGGARQRGKECERENPLGFHLVDSLCLGENVFC